MWVLVVLLFLLLINEILRTMCRFQLLSIRHRWTQLGICGITYPSMYSCVCVASTNKDCMQDSSIETCIIKSVWLKFMKPRYLIYKWQNNDLEETSFHCRTWIYTWISSQSLNDDCRSPTSSIADACHSLLPMLQVMYQVTNNTSSWHANWVAQRNCSWGERREGKDLAVCSIEHSKKIWALTIIVRQIMQQSPCE